MKLITRLKPYFALFYIMALSTAMVPSVYSAMTEDKSMAQSQGNDIPYIAKGVGKDFGFGAIGFDLAGLVDAMGVEKVKDLRIGIAVNTQKNNWQLMWVEEFESLAKQYGFRLTVLNADDDQIKQADDLKSLENQQVDGVIVFPAGTSAMSAPITALYGKIPVVTAIPVANAKVAATIDVLQTAKGAMIADRVADDAAGKTVNVLMLDDSNDLQHLRDRVDGFAMQAKAKYPNIHIVDSRREKSQDGWLNVAKESLLAHEDINTIVGTYTLPMLGGYSAAKELKREVNVYGVDADEITLKMLEKGDIKGLHVQWPNAQAYTCLFTLLQVLNGTQFEKTFMESDAYAMSYAKKDDAKKMYDLLYPK